MATEDAGLSDYLADVKQSCRRDSTVQEVTGDAAAVACVDQGYTGAHAAEDAPAQHMRLAVVKLPEAKKGFVLLLRRWW